MLSRAGARVEPEPYVETEPEPDSVEWHELHPFGDAEIGV